jgi:hypothetical protein
MRKLLLLLLPTLLLSACAGNPFVVVQPGMAREAVIQKMGQPSRVVRLPAGERLQYSQQPAGQYAWMVDLDAAGRVTQARQVLTATEFSRIELGKWTRDDVEREFGRPARIDAVANWNGPIMTYRWRDAGNINMFYWVYLDQNNVVRRAHPGMERDPEPREPPERRMDS